MNLKRFRKNFPEKGYPSVLDADVIQVENNQMVPIKFLLKWKETKMLPMHILEIADGVRKLADVDNLRFRYYKNFKSMATGRRKFSNLPQWTKMLTLGPLQKHI